MKKIILAIFLICGYTSYSFSKSIKCKSKYVQDTLLTYLQSISLAQYYNKPIDSLIAHLPQNILEMKVLSSSKIDYAGGLYIKYTPSVYILIKVTDFNILNPHNPNKLPVDQVWRIDDMRKEKIYSIRIFNGLQVINYTIED